MLLITFAFSIGAIYKAIDIMAKGFPVGIIGRFFIYNLPYSIAYTIPISALFATLLLFGRLSSDSEISAMKSAGLSLWQIAAPILLISFLPLSSRIYIYIYIYCLLVCSCLLFCLPAALPACSAACCLPAAAFLPACCLSTQQTLGM